MHFLLLCLLTVSTRSIIVNGLCKPENKCPMHCNCESIINSGLRVDCSSNHFHDIPDDLPNCTRELLLNDNFITHISDYSFQQCDKLELLDLSKNKIKKLAVASFKALTCLKVLHLNGNCFRYDELPRSVFNFSSDLRELHLHNSNWSNLTAYPQSLVDGLINLEILSIDGFPGAVFDGNFSQLKRLKTLRVYGGLNIVRNETFASFRHVAVEKVSLKTGQNLLQLEPGSFAPFTDLRTLDLGYNRGLGFKNVSEAWWGLQFTNITKLVLTRIIIDGEQATIITGDFFNYLNLTKIKTLLIDKNNIVDMEPRLSKTLPFLVYLDMSYNRMSNVKSFLHDLTFLSNLEYLDCSHQMRRYLPAANRNYYDEQEIPGRQIAVEKKTDPYKNNSSNDWFTHQCQIRELPRCSTSALNKYNKLLFTSSFARDNGRPLSNDGSWCFMLPKNLKVVNLTESVNVDMETLHPVIILRSGHVLKLEYRNNGIKRLVYPFVVTVPIELTLDLSNNGLTCIAPDLFKYSAEQGSHTISLNLTGNYLADQLQNDFNGITFRNYGNMSALHLAWNGIKSLPEKIFIHTSHLETLNLSHNSLRAMKFEFKHLSHLVELDLSYNLLATFDSSVMNKLTAMFHSNTSCSNMSIDLTGNPLQCSCDTLQFLRWISSHRLHIINFEEYSCLFNGTFTSFLYLDNLILIDLNYFCSLRIAVIVSALVTGFIIVVIALSMCAYRHRREIEYFFLWLTNRARLNQMENDNKSYEYDAFVIYAYGDSQWVTDELLPHLETLVERDNNELNTSTELLIPGNYNCNRLKLCVHDRDFVPGEVIFDNIHDAIDRSRKVILVISPNFARSQFCPVELEWALMESIQRNRQLLVPVLLEPVPSASLTSSVRRIVRKMTYLEWPKDDHEDDERIIFWNRLRKAVSSGKTFKLLQ